MRSHAWQFVKRLLGREAGSHTSPVSSMRSFWGLMRAYWLSERWREAWGLTFAILVLTALTAQASVWFAVTSGELINRIAYFHHPATPTTPMALLTTAATLAAIAIMRDVCFTAVRHFFSTTLHRKWRAWLDRRFNEALLDSNHTHFHLLQMGSDASGSAVPAPDNIDQRVQESIKGMTGGAIGLGMGIAGVVLSLGFVGSKLIEMSSDVRGFEFLGSYGSACLAFVAVAIYVAAQHRHCRQAWWGSPAPVGTHAMGGGKLPHRIERTPPPQLPCRRPPWREGPECPQRAPVSRH
ncbi:hypothetical protein [Ensifer sp. YR511]|uniref:hypothetical protein n=1 Tax=Ensifer sp. YR511 TaxID=1855294 RepID=UPI00088BAF7B|nr:hypothetical protein [Ensifer sp. YR511]SDN14696.1 ABC transporter transmembrane region 2 [Ensifer sp. YR511]